jgi:hypothetical protein
VDDDLPHPHLPRWTPIKVKVWPIPLGKRKPRPLPDFPYFTGPVLTGRSLECLRDLVAPYGEFLPLDCDDGREYLQFNCLNFIDAFDRERSVFRELSGGRAQGLKHCHFKAGTFEDQVIFRTIETGSRTFVTDTFVQRVLDCELTGFRFYRPELGYRDSITPFAPKRPPKRRKPGTPK